MHLTVRHWRIPAVLIAVLVALTFAVAGAGTARADLDPPPPGCVVGTNDGGLNHYNIKDNGSGSQATLARNDTCMEFVNKTIVGTTQYWQLKDGDFSLCLTDASAPAAKFAACETTPGADQLVRITGTGNNLVQFDQGAEYLTTASLNNGANVQVQTAVPGVDGEWLFTKNSPFLQVLPVDFTASGPTSSDWTAIEQSPPPYDVHSAIFEVCETINMVQKCGGDTTQADTAWDPTLKALCDAGVQPLYYIDTKFAADSLSSIEGAIANALTWYPQSVTDCPGGVGIMLDEVAPTDPSCGTNCLYYQSLVNYITTQNGGVQAPIFLNAGGITNTDYTTYSSNVILQTYEGASGSSTTGWENTSFQEPSWFSTCGCQSQLSATITRPVGDTSYQQDLTLAADRGFGHVYVESIGEPNPNYATLPSYFAGETWNAAQYFNQ